MQYTRSTQLIYSSVQERVGFSVRDCQQLIRGQFKATSSRSFPQLTPHQIHLLCKAQEQTILQKILARRPMDIYQQIASVCPQGREIKTLTNQQVDNRIEQKMQLAQRELNQSGDDQLFSEDHSGGLMEDGQLGQGQMMQVSYQSMSNLFQVCEHHHSWSPQDLLQLN